MYIVHVIFVSREHEKYSFLYARERIAVEFSADQPTKHYIRRQVGKAHRFL